MIFDYNVVWEALPMYFGGLLTTLKLLAISLFFGLLAAIPLGLMRVSRQPVVNLAAWLYTYVIRGTPMLVQLFLIYYGLAQFEAVREYLLAAAVQRYLLRLPGVRHQYQCLYRRNHCRQPQGDAAWRDRSCQGHGDVAHENVPPHPAAFGTASGTAAVQQ